MTSGASNAGAQGPSAKPIDLGTGRVAASFGHADPALLSVTGVHPELGVVELTGASRFVEARRGDPVATRAFRRGLASDASACCWLEGPRGERPSHVASDCRDVARPRWRGRLGTAGLEAVAGINGDGCLELGWRVHGWKYATPPRIRFRGRVALPVLAEITETDPPAPIRTPTSLRVDAHALLASSPRLGTVATLAIAGSRWHRVHGGMAADLPSSAPGEFGGVMRIGFELLGGGTNHAPATLHGGKGPSSLPGGPVTERSLAYVRGCTALQVRPDERVLLTDHRLLPLSWTRDAYYQALLLLATGLPQDAAVVADHLRWLWRTCRRDAGVWSRSHYADGRAKDRGFQADQQVFPLLEACDHWRATGRLPAGVDWEEQLTTTWHGLVARLDHVTGLLPSSENAADDPAAMPFIASSQVLLWYAAMRLRELAACGHVKLAPGELRAAARRIRRSFDQYFAGEAGPWPYAVDGRGGSIAYHDANDLPLALAPVWGFCNSVDAGWRATVAFAWSPANPGWFAGPRGGLGSVHTPGPWTLGDVQDWIVGRIMGDADRTERALHRLGEVAYADGMLPEAYSATRHPDIRIRTWFAWPGAAIGGLLLLDAGGCLEKRLVGHERA